MVTEPFDNRLRSALSKQTGMPAFLLMLLPALLIFSSIAWQLPYDSITRYGEEYVSDNRLLTAGIFCFIFLVTMLAQRKELLSTSFLTACLFTTITGLVILGKFSILDYESTDYDYFLVRWLGELAELTVPQGLGWNISSDYTPPYLYILLVISRFKTYPWNYLIKFVSIACDALLGYSVLRMTSLQYKNPVVRLTAFSLATLLPTVVFNGAFWAQCDCIYTSLCILAITMAMQKRDKESMLLFGLALSYKLQTVFFFPILLPLWLRKDIRLRSLFLIPLSYMIMMVPALLAGKPLLQVLTVYLHQTWSNAVLTMNAPTLYQFFAGSGIDVTIMYNMFSRMALFLAAGYMAFLCLLICTYKDSLTDEVLLLFLLLFLSGVPFFLPKMHERYMFAADIVSLIVCFTKPRRRIFLPACFVTGSYLLCTSLVEDPVLPGKYGSLLILTGLLLTGIELHHCLHHSAKSPVVIQTEES